MTGNRSRWVWLCLGVLTSGCGPKVPEPPRLRVAAASDLQHALPILIAAFRQDHDIAVDLTFGSSGQLAEQIRQGAPFDVFLCANHKIVATLADQGIVQPDSVRPYARGWLVLAVNKLSAVRVKTLDDLTRPEVHKIAIANPDTAPYGMAAKQALERANLWDQLRPKIVPAESVRQALQFVQTGNAEVGFVGRSIVDVPEVVAVHLPPKVCDPIVQSLGIVAQSKNTGEAKAFVDFLLSVVGQEMLVDLGFSRAPELEPRKSK